MGQQAITENTSRRGRDVILGTIATAYGAVSLLTLVPVRTLAPLSLFLIVGPLRLLERLHPAVPVILTVILSFPFLIGGVALLTGRGWGTRAVRGAAGLSIAVLAAGSLLSAAASLSFLAPLLGAFARPLELYLFRYLRLFTYFSFSALPAAIPLVPMWLATGRPRWIQGKFARINGWVWGALCALSIFSGPVMFVTMWITAPYTRTSNHGLYAAVLYSQAALYLFTVATSRKWFVMAALLLAAPFVAGSIMMAGLYGACFFFGECL